MKKTVSLLISFLFVITVAVSVMATPAINAKHKNLKKNGQNVASCAYCHGTTAKPEIAKKKANYLKAQANYKAIGKMAKCAGSGCHN